MRLHRLTLRDVKGVRERTVDFPDRGVMVIEGPNEVGKTTLLDAFDALLTFKATSKAAGVRALQPVDRDVAPFVEAELTIGGQRLRYAKQWLRQPSTTLHVLSPRPEQLTGDVAQQRLDWLLSSHLDRTLWDALRLTQAGDGSVAPLVSSSVLTAALDAAAGAHQHVEGADALLDRVAAEHALYFTATGRPTGDYRAAMSRWTDAQDTLAEAHRRVEEGVSLLERQSLARDRLGSAETEASASADRLAEAERAAAAVEQIAAAHASAAERLGHATELHAAAVRARQQRERLVTDRAALDAEIEAAETARQADLAAAEAERDGLLAAEAAAQRAATEVERAAVELDATRADADHLADVRELAAREAVLEEAARLVGEVRRAQEALPSRPVEREEARNARALHDRLDAMVLQHTATTPALDVEAIDSTVEVDLADDGGHASVAAGERLVVSVAHDTTVEIPGHARIRIRLHQEALGRVAEINRLREQLAGALGELGVQHIDEADELALATEQARSVLREASRDVEALLRPWGRDLAAQAAAGALPAGLTEQVEAARERASRTLAARAADRELPPDETAARAAVDAAGAALRQARQEEHAASDALTARRRQVAALTARLDRAEGHIGAQEARVQALDAELAEARGETPDDALAAQVAERAELVAAATRAERAAAQAVAAADVAGVRAARDSARHHHRLVSGARDAALAELHQLTGQVEMAAGEGRQELYDLAVADLDDAQRELQAVDRRARAARHLFTTLNRHRDAAHRAYVRPYTQALEELGRRVYGEDFAVSVDEDLSLAARTLDGATVPFTELSGGAKEQLGILARLAVARLVDPTQGVPVVIDDALGYSDPQRLRQMGEVLGSSGEDEADVQVILLTCTPERYAAIPHVHTVRLTA